MQADDDAPLVLRIPHGEDLDGGHQAAREADADQDPRDDQLGQRGAKSEQRRAECGDKEQDRLHLARAVAVERHALQRLNQREEQEERRCKKSEIGRSDADVALEIREDHRVHAAEDVGEEIGERERQEDPQQQRRKRLGVSRHCLFWASKRDAPYSTCRKGSKAQRRSAITSFARRAATTSWPASVQCKSVLR